MPNYVPYHVHSDLSNLVSGQGADCTTPFTMYIDKANELGMKAISISEHGSLVHWLKKQEYAEKNGIKYIHGAEFYITYSTKPEHLVRDNFHLGLYAKNWEGFQEILKMSSKSFTGRNKTQDPDDKHYYYNPRITFEELFATSDNVIVTTACLGSPLWQLHKQEHGSYGYEKLTQEEREFAAAKLREFEAFLTANKHRCFLEIQYHEHIEQQEFNWALQGLAQTTGCPLIAGTDTHAINQDYADSRVLLLKAKGASYGDEDSFDLTFPSYEELVERFEKQSALPAHVYLEAIENTNKFADMVESFTVDREPKYPRLWENSEQDFKDAINEGFKKRRLHRLPKKKREVYLARIQEEFEVYKKLDAIDYMLLMKQVLDWCREQDISTGPSRGSCSGSLIAYLLYVTDMDSVQHGLNFFRFLNPARISLPD